MGKHFKFVWLGVSSIKTGKRRIMHPDELSFEMRLERRTTRDGSSKRVIFHVPVYKRRKTRRTKNVCPSSSRRIIRLYYKNGEDGLSFWTDNSSSSIACLEFLRLANLSKYFFRPLLLYFHYSLFVT